jgi:folate-dependent tRNA-U54 methylase TrmFO/GidA
VQRTNLSDIVIVGGGIAGSGLAAKLAAAGLRVDVLERTIEYPDRVRGEMYCPWGVAIADDLGLLEPLLDAGASFSTRWVFYDDALPVEVAEELGVDTSAILPGVPASSTAPIRRRAKPCAITPRRRVPSCIAGSTGWTSISVTVSRS